MIGFHFNPTCVIPPQINIAVAIRGNNYLCLLAVADQRNSSGVLSRPRSNGELVRLVDLQCNSRFIADGVAPCAATKAI